MRTGKDEARQPKYAHVERERRWLVDPTRRPCVDGLSHVLVEDAYIIGTRLRLRRMTDSANNDHAYKLTKKYEADDPLARPIVTFYLTEQEFDLLASLPARTLAKRRYAMPVERAIFSLDRFEGPLAGLELVEIEWPDDAGLRTLRAPPWAIREVSAEPDYQGGALAEFGIPEED